MEDLDRLPLVDTIWSVVCLDKMHACVEHVIGDRCVKKFFVPSPVTWHLLRSLNDAVIGQKSSWLISCRIILEFCLRHWVRLKRIGGRSPTTIRDGGSGPIPTQVDERDNHVETITVPHFNPADLRNIPTIL